MKMGRQAGYTAREFYERQGPGDPAIIDLLRTAEQMHGGGPAAVRHYLCTRELRTVLTGAIGWDIFATLPRLVAMDRVSLRCLLAQWAQARKRRRAGVTAAGGGNRLRLWSSVPRSCLAEVLMQLSAPARSEPA